MSKTNCFHLFFVITLFLLIAACGGGGGGGGDDQSGLDSGTGILVDSPVSGVAYVCMPSGKSGTTSAGGEYEFSAGDTVTFSIGDIVFPSITASSVVTVLDLAGADKTTDTKAVNIARLLQSLDDDGDINETITISESTISALTGLADPVIDFSSASFDTELAEVVSVTGITLVSDAAAIEHLTTELAALPDIGDSPASLVESVITVDGSTNDWAGIVPVALDPQGDQNGNSSTDLVSLSAVMDGDNMVLLMETAGPITMPHTPSQDSSHYEVGIHAFSDSNCSNEIGFIIANNFTDSVGQNYHQLDSYVTDVSPGGTLTAFQNSYLETSFDASQFLSVASSFAFNPYIQSFGASNIMHDASRSDRKCFAVNTSSVGGGGSTGASLVGAWYAGTANDYNIVVFLDETRYFVAHTNNSEFDAAIGATVPVSGEYGTYTWDSTSGTFNMTALGQSDGEGGLSHPLGDVTVAVDGSNLTFTDTVDGSFATTKISSQNSIIGAWYAGTANDYNIIVFLDETRYYVAHTNNLEFDAVIGATVPVSGEYGTYTWDTNSGAFTSTAAGQSDGEGGLSHPLGDVSLAVDGSILTLTDSVDGSFTLTRVE